MHKIAGADLGVHVFRGFSYRVSTLVCSRICQTHQLPFGLMRPVCRSSGFLRTVETHYVKLYTMLAFLNFLLIDIQTELVKLEVLDLA